MVGLAAKVWPSGDFWVGVPGGSAPMGLADLANSHNREARGQRGISSRGRRRVREGAVILERRFGIGRLSFLTCTIPGATLEQLQAIANSWAEIVRQFTQQLRRRLIAKGLRASFVGVTELQPDRWKERREPALHLHIAFVGRHERAAWAYPPAEFKRLWQRTVERVASPGLDWSAGQHAHVCSVKKSVSAYLGKYMSKGSKEVSEVLAALPGWPMPKDWTVCSSSLRRAITNQTCTLGAELAGDLWAWCRRGSRLFAWMIPIEGGGLSSERATDIVGYCGSLLPEIADYYRQQSKLVCET